MKKTSKWLQVCVALTSLFVLLTPGPEEMLIACTTTKSSFCAEVHSTKEVAEVGHKNPIPANHPTVTHYTLPVQIHRAFECFSFSLLEGSVIFILDLRTNPFSKEFMTWRSSMCIHNMLFTQLSLSLAACITMYCTLVVILTKY